jgi:hypothetical protein
MILLAIALALPPQDTPATTTARPEGIVTADQAGQQHPSGHLQDDGYGKCPAFSHYHARDPKTDASLDGKCHRDSDDSVIDDAPRKELPKP